MNKNYKNQKGVALISALLILVMLFIMAYGLASFASSDRSVIYYNDLETKSFYLANSGMEYVMYLIKHNMLLFPFEGRHTYGPYLEGLQDINGNAITKAGQLINVFCYNDLNSGQFHDGQEHLLLRDNFVYDEANSTKARYLGTFHVKVIEAPDNISSSTNNRVLLVTSIGKIRENVNNLSQEQTNVDTFDNTNFPIVYQKTITARIPYIRGDGLEMPRAINKALPITVDLEDSTTGLSLRYKRGNKILIDWWRQN